MTGHKSAFVVVEGLEGAGKSTVISAINEYLSEHQLSYINTREPGGTPMAEAIRNCVKERWEDEQVTQETELLLMYAARSQLVHNVILPALQEGKVVVGDRHNLSSIAYQGGGRQVPAQVLQQLSELTMRSFRPDFTIYLDIEPSVGLERARGRGELDRIEESGLAFFERARERYLDELSLIMQDNSESKYSDNAIIIDAHQSPENVAQQAVEALSLFLNSNGREEN